LPQTGRWIIVALLVVLAMAVYLDNSKRENGTVALAVAGLAVLFALIDPRLVRDADELSIGSFTVKRGVAAKEAKEAAKVQQDDEDSEATARTESLVALRLRLEAKLVYLAKHQLNGYFATPRPTQDLRATAPPTYLTVGSLLVDDGLTADEAERATQVLTASEAALRRLPRGDREEFLTRANYLVRNFRAVVHRNLTRHEVFAAAAADAAVEKRFRGTASPYLRLPGVNEELVVVPVYAISKASKMMERANTRLAKLDLGKARACFVLVVPDNSRTLPPTKQNCELDAQPVVVALSDLCDWLSQRLSDD
jgi:hypothetical protein